MNCKPGDLAIVINSFAGNEGLIVTVVDPYIGPEILPLGPRWFVDSDVKTLMGRPGHARNTLADSQLRPLRDTDGQDETITWAGKPEKVTQ